MKGKVFLVGAGPGDPGLFTIKGLESLKKAEIIVYDYLATPRLLDYALDSAKLIYVGKKGGDHSFSQNEINDLLIKYAKKGKVVIRLKGGDPFMFGRGGEEAEVLAQSGIDFEVIPGVTSAISVPAYAGIPLTHRQYSSDVTFVTGHEDFNRKDSNINWKILGMGTGTLVFFMGIKNISSIIKNLKFHGRSEKTPVGVIQWGTTYKQVTVLGTLNDIVKKCEDSFITPPAIIIVGNVVKLKNKLRWFDRRPLLGKSVVVTRARGQASKLVNALSEIGANCIECPTIKIVPTNDWQIIDRAIENLNKYSWLIFTSTNGVNHFFNRFFKNGKDLRSLGHIKTAVVGSSTASRLFKFGLKSDVLPKEYCAESVVKEFSKYNINGERVCFPCAAVSREIISTELSKMGAIVDELVVYRTLISDILPNDMIQKFKEKKIDLLTFTSSSTVKNFSSIFPRKKFEKFINEVTVACIGPITAKTASLYGFKVDIVASIYTIEGLIDSIIKYYS